MRKIFYLIFMILVPMYSFAQQFLYTAFDESCCSFKSFCHCYALSDCSPAQHLMGKDDNVFYFFLREPEGCWMALYLRPDGVDYYSLGILDYLYDENKNEIFFAIYSYSENVYRFYLISEKKVKRLFSLEKEVLSLIALNCSVNLKEKVLGGSENQWDNKNSTFTEGPIWKNKLVLFFNDKDSLSFSLGVKSSPGGGICVSKYDNEIINLKICLNNDYSIKSSTLIEKGNLSLFEGCDYFRFFPLSLESTDEELFSVKEFNYDRLSDVGKFCRERYEVTSMRDIKKSELLLLDKFFSMLYEENFFVQKNPIQCKLNYKEGSNVYKSSSNLKEGGVIYGSKNLRSSNGIPWVEGVSGYGIGEFIEIYSSEDINYISIYNGYQSVDKPDLYEKNSRVKKIKIECNDFEKTQIYAYLKDSKEEQFVHIPVEDVTAVKITILDVYEGSLYKDTCIDAVFINKVD